MLILNVESKILPPLGMTGQLPNILLFYRCSAVNNFKQ
jgi:hypothetical protein